MTENGMGRALRLGALLTLTCPVTLLAQGIPAAPAALPVDSLARAASAASAANTVAINFVWTLITGFLVMFMQAGFAMVETGFTRGKNAAHTFAMNFMVYGIGMLAYWAIGFALQAGGLGPMATLGGFDKLNQEFALSVGGKTWGLFGHTGFFLSGVAYAAPVFAYFLFQMVFMDTAATIPTGAMAERWKFAAFVVFSVFIGALIYPLFANWTWGGGWLSQLGVNLGLGHGHVDFAGSSVVHMTGGVIALVGAWLIGPRRGKYNADGTPNAIPGHNIPMALVGTFILCFGWFGFNPGSTLAGSDLRIGVIATNTMLAGAAGSVTAMLYMWWKYGKPDPSMMANGALAGLVAITAPCAFVTAPSAVLIGGVAGVLVCAAVFFIDGKLHIDDPVGAISVHGVNGFWGILSVGLLADGTYGDGWNGVNGAVRGLFYGDASQLVAQLVGGLTNFVAVGAMTYAAYKLTAVLVGGHRVSADVEELGLDLPEMGALAYPDTPEVASAVILRETASVSRGGVGQLEPEPEAV
ncbi:MAG: ammonium transporter [Gemmatimonadetes bacterium]|nr:MAG: ammonium transporter [Gemmatimonadota bacterium]PYO99096.1 MAG: ammonium transporter [Gemmatimonadota bacterium]TLY53853.1 MAG: ammonium transporter [Gemmatimonadota bacterium]